MYRLLEPDEVIKKSDEYIPGCDSRSFVPIKNCPLIKDGDKNGNMVIRRKIEDPVCKEDCINYGNKGVCVFCSLDPANSNLYKKGEMNASQSEKKN